MLQLGLILKRGASPCPPEWACAATQEPARVFAFQSLQGSPLMRYLQLARMTASVSRACTSPRLELQQSSLPVLPQTYRSPRPGRPSSNRVHVTAQRCRRDSPNPQLTHGHSQPVMPRHCPPNPSTSEPSPSLRCRTSAPPHAEHCHPCALVAVSVYASPVTQRTDTGYVRGMTSLKLFLWSTHPPGERLPQSHEQNKLIQSINSNLSQLWACYALFLAKRRG